MEFFKTKTRIDFMGLRRLTAALSGLVFVFSLICLIFRGLNFGLDFTGGTQFQLSYEKPADMKAVRHALQTAGLEDAIVQSYGSSRDLLITLAPHQEMSQQALRQKLKQALPNARMNSMNYIGPQVGKEMTEKGFLAILVALLGTMLYIAIRFEWRFAVGAVAALLHDPVIILGLFSLFQWEFNLTVLAAVLAVIGYSLNDTIVIFDRIRENFRKKRQETTWSIINLSINQTLSRTVMTSAMTLVVVLALFFYGGNPIHGFSMALIIGIIVGTYSSIYVASALTAVLGLSREDFIPLSKKHQDTVP